MPVGMTALFNVHCRKGSAVEGTELFACNVSGTLVGTIPTTLASFVRDGSLVTSTNVSSTKLPSLAENASTISAGGPGGPPPGPVTGKSHATICNGRAPTVWIKGAGGSTCPSVPSVTLQKRRLLSPVPPP